MHCLRVFVDASRTECRKLSTTISPTVMMLQLLVSNNDGILIESRQDGIMMATG